MEVRAKKRDGEVEGKKSERQDGRGKGVKWGRIVILQIWLLFKETMPIVLPGNLIIRL
jgi:hypothetical protein